MTDHLRRRHPLGRVPPQTLSNKVDSVSRTIRYNSCQWYLRKLRNAYPPLGRLLHSLRPAVTRRTQHRYNLANLIHLRIAQKQRLVEIHFCNDASDREYVHSRRVGRKLEQEFRGPVPTSRDVFSVWRLTPDFARDTKVDDFDGQVVVNEDVLGLHIAMEKPLLVDVQ
jgi:hypothetical protein